MTEHQTPSASSGKVHDHDNDMASNEGSVSVGATVPTPVRYRGVLVPLDGTERSEIALRSGRALATRLGAVLHVVAVAGDVEDLPRLRTAAATALGTEAIDERIHTVHGVDPARAIAGLADELGSCLVCMSSRAHGRLTGAILGSTARAVLQARGEPIVVVGPLADRPLYLGDTWIEPLAGDQVVVCVDTDDGATDDDTTDDDTASAAGTASATVRVAAAWASALGMSLTVLTVAPADDSLSGTDRTDRRAALLDRVVGPGSAAATDASTLGVRLDVHVQLDPIGAVAGVRSYLAAHPTGLLVVSTHARTGLDRVWSGATAAGIAAASTVATLVVPIR